MNRLERLLGGWRFPVVALSMLGFASLLSGATLLVPPGDTAFHAFAQEFRAWCFGYDPATGHSQPIIVVMMLSEPLVLGAIVALIWWGPLREGFSAPKQMVPTLAASLLLVTGGAWGMSQLKVAPAQGEMPFPAERLRTSYKPPSFVLTDQHGEKVSLEEQRGKVVILTGIYATCGFTCPMILRQAKRAVSSLTEAQREDVVVLAVTLDPARDTPEAMAKMAEGQQVSAPTFRLLTGEPGPVNDLLDRMGVERRRNAETGAIDHTNLFLVVDREGRIAYRFSLGDRQENWLTRALEYLLREPRVG